MTYRAAESKGWLLELKAYYIEFLTSAVIPVTVNESFWCQEILGFIFRQLVFDMCSETRFCPCLPVFLYFYQDFLLQWNGFERKGNKKVKFRDITRRKEGEREMGGMTDGPKEERAAGFSTAAELSIWQLYSRLCVSGSTFCTSLFVCIGKCVHAHAQTVPWHDATIYLGHFCVQPDRLCCYL